MPNLTNLLPEDRRHSLSKEYWLRLLTVVALALSLLLVIHTVLLVPSVVYLSEEVETRSGHLADVRALFGSSEEQTLGARALDAEADAVVLSGLVALPEALPIVEAILGEPRTGVRISGLSITPSLEGGEAKMSVSGIASTRDALRRYHDALSKLPFVSSADLPLSVYAAEADLPFTIALTGILP